MSIFLTNNQKNAIKSETKTSRRLSLRFSYLISNINNSLSEIRTSFNNMVLDMDFNNINFYKPDNTKISISRNMINLNRYRAVELDLTELDVETMYPVLYKPKSNFTSEDMPISDVYVHRAYWKDRTLSGKDENGNWKKQNTRFSDGYVTPWHVASLGLRKIQSGLHWNGDAVHTFTIPVYMYRYMHTVQFFDSYGIYCFLQEFDQKSWLGNDHHDVENVDITNIPIPDNVDGVKDSFTGTGFYLRGGLHYTVYYRGVEDRPSGGYLSEPINLITEPTLIRAISGLNRTEWLTPVPYKRSNNSSIINNYNGKAIAY